MYSEKRDILPYVAPEMCVLDAQGSAVICASDGGYDVTIPGFGDEDWT